MAQFNGFGSFVGLVSDTSANGTARNGATMAMGVIQPGTLSVDAQATIVTGSVVATFNPQVSMDGTNWSNVVLSNNAALVTLTATGKRALQLCGLEGWRYFRCQATLSGAATAAGDLTVVTYRYQQYGRAGAV